MAHSQAALIQDPALLLAALALLVGGLFWLEERPLGARLFRFLPALVWVYFLPMLGAAAGLLPGSSPLYGALQGHLLPCVLLLLLATSDLSSVGRAGPMALALFLAGAAGIVLGALFSLLLVGPFLEADAWRGFGALAGSWIGGSANLVALSSVFEAGEGLIGQIVVVDTVVGYGWVGVLIALAPRQKALDRIFRARGESLGRAGHRLEALAVLAGRPMRLADATAVLALAAGGGLACMHLGGFLPERPGLVNSFAWGLLSVSVLGIGLSFTPVARLRACGADRLGLAGIYVILASVGARADLHGVLGAPVLLLAGLLWMLVHILVLVAAARLLRAPFFFLAVGSTACIGGPASAPLVAAVYQPRLAPIGLLLAVLGNTLGYSLGYATGLLCRLLGR